MNQLSGKKGLVMGVANERSIAWGIAKALMRRAQSLRLPIKAKVLANAGTLG